MDINTILEILSACNLGAIILNTNYEILSINEAGNSYLFGTDTTPDSVLPAHFHALCENPEKASYVSTGFNTFVIAHPAPTVDTLLPDEKLIVFRDATSEYQRDVLYSVCSHLKEGLIVCDAESRISYMNDPAMRMDMLTEEAVLGKTVAEVYHMTDSTVELPLPKALKTKSPRLNYRQHYVTRDGKEVTAVANTWPVMKNNQLLAAFNILEDTKQINKMQQRIIELQDQLRNEEAKKSGSTIGKTKYSFDDIITANKNMIFTVSQCRQVARTDSAVMIYGETGTGKELFAQSIHHASGRCNQPFLAINCAALPANLLEGLLFGSVKGAYTGAENRPGLFEQANHGTLLLDEINSMDISLQAKLLRVLQEGSIRRLGGDKEISVDVRVLSCINEAPQKAISEGKLRQDLFYRLGVVNIMIPPLRNRTDDIPHLVKHFLWKYNEKLSMNVTALSPSVLQLFSRYPWPGNVRELQHAIEHALNVIPPETSVISLNHIPQVIVSDAAITPQGSQFLSHLNTATVPESAGNPISLHSQLHDVEKDSIMQALQATGGNISQASKQLNMSRQNLQYRIKKYKLSITDFKK